MSADLKFYVWCGSRRLVLLSSSPLVAAQQLIKRAMADSDFDGLENIIHVSMMGFEASLFQFSFQNVLLSIEKFLD